MCVNICKDKIDYLLLKKEFGGTEICPEVLKYYEEKEIENIQMKSEVKDLLAEMLHTARLTNEKMIKIVDHSYCPSYIKETLKSFIKTYPNTRDRANSIKWSVSAIGYEFSEEIIFYAAVVELLHLAMIFTDNLFDKTQTCVRGEKIIEEPWIKYSPEMTYICAELLTSIALESFTNKFKDVKNYAKIISKLITSIQENYIAEYIDIKLQNIDYADYSEYIEMARKLEGIPLANAIIGALYLIDYDEDKMESFREYGEILGIMMKIRNDIFDIDPNSDKAAIGKEPGEDINAENIFMSKKTLPIIYFLADLTENEGIKLEERKNFNERRIVIMQNILKRKYIEKSIHELQRYKDHAMNKISHLAESKGKLWLKSFIAFVGETFSLRG